MTNQTAVEAVKSLPQSLDIKIQGNKGPIEINARMSVLTPDQKLERNSVFQIGRLVEDPETVEFISEGEIVATAVRGDKNWKVSFPGSDETKEVERSTTKRPGDETRLDPGPDLFKAATWIAKQVWPELASVARGGGGAVTKALKAELAQKEAQMAALITLLQKAGIDTSELEALGVTVDGDEDEVEEVEDEEVEDEE